MCTKIMLQKKKNGSLKFISPNIPPMNGPSIKPIPKAAPINPKFLALSSEEETSAKYAIAVGTVPPAIPPIILPTINTQSNDAKPNIK